MGKVIIKDGRNKIVLGTCFLKRNMNDDITIQSNEAVKWQFY